MSENSLAESSFRELESHTLPEIAGRATTGSINEAAAVGHGLWRGILGARRAGAPLSYHSVSSILNLPALPLEALFPPLCKATGRCLFVKRLGGL